MSKEKFEQLVQELEIDGHLIEMYKTVIQSLMSNGWSEDSAYENTNRVIVDAFSEDDDDTLWEKYIIA